MGPFHIPLSISVVYALGIIAVPVSIELLLHSKWWRKQSDYYYSFNDYKKKQQKDVTQQREGKDYEN